MDGSQDQNAMDNMAPDSSISNNIQNGGAASQLNLNQGMVELLEQRFQQNIPTLQDLAQFMQGIVALSKINPQFVKQLVLVCPELMVALQNVSTDMESNGNVAGGTDPNAQQQGGAPSMPQMLQGNGGMMPPGGADGATAPQLQTPPSSPQGAPPMGGAPAGGPPSPFAGGAQPAPAATTYGNPPPSMPTPNSPLRQQFFGK